MALKLVKSFQLTEENITKIIKVVTYYTNIEIVSDENDIIKSLIIGDEKEGNRLTVNFNEWVNVYSSGKITVTNEPV